MRLFWRSLVSSVKIINNSAAVQVNSALCHFVFDAHLCDRFYQNKPIKPFMFFDITSVLVHYILALDTMDDLGKEPCIKDVNLFFRFLTRTLPFEPFEEFHSREIFAYSPQQTENFSTKSNHVYIIDALVS